MRRTLLVLLVALLLLPAHGGGQRQTTFELYGHGNTTCEKWLAASGSAHDGMLEWTLGYVTAAGYYTAAIWNGLLDANPELAAALSGYCRQHPDARLCRNQLVKKTDAAAIAAWLTLYCRDHPKDDLATAGRALIESLGDR